MNNLLHELNIYECYRTTGCRSGLVLAILLVELFICFSVFHFSKNKNPAIISRGWRSEPDDILDEDDANTSLKNLSFIQLSNEILGYPGNIAVQCGFPFRFPELVWVSRSLYLELLFACFINHDHPEHTSTLIKKKAWPTALELSKQMHALIVFQ